MSAEHGHEHGGGHEAAHDDGHGAGHDTHAPTTHGHDTHAPAAHGHEAAHDDGHGAGHDTHAPATHGHEAAHDDGHGGGHDTHAPAAHGHEAAHSDGHGAGHDTHAPATHGHEAAHGSHAPAGGRSPIIKARDGIFAASASVVGMTAAFGDGINKALRAGDLPPVSKKSILETPFYAVGHVADGTLLNVGRRGMEVVSPAISFIRSFISTTVGTILKPSNLTNGETKKNAIGMVKSVGMLGKNVLMAAPRALNDLADRAVDRTVQQVSAQIERIPVVGKLISGPLKWISGGIKKAVAAVTNVADIITSPLGGRSMSGATADHGHGGHDAHGGGHDAHGGGHDYHGHGGHH